MPHPIEHDAPAWSFVRAVRAVTAAYLVLAALDAAPAAAQAPPLGPPLGADPRRDSSHVAAAVEVFHRALAAGDSAAALALLAPGVVILEGGGAETLAEYRAHHLPADIAFARATRPTRSPVRVAVRGDAAWATSTSTVTGSSRGRAVNAAGAELMVLVREPSARDGSAWRIAAIHWSSRTRRPAP